MNASATQRVRRTAVSGAPSRSHVQASGAGAPPRENGARAGQQDELGVPDRPETRLLAQREHRFHDDRIRRERQQATEVACRIEEVRIAG
jgi:hypothetical protein